jgi:ankyrin repeat protein
MKHFLLTTIAAVVLVGSAFADPIHDAAWDADLAGVQAELDKGVDVNVKNVSGRTPLHDAAMRGHNEIAELLIAAGADVNAKMEDGYTPLDVAFSGFKTIDIIRKHGGKTKEELDEIAKGSIHAAAQYGNIEAVKQHLAAGADVNAKDGEGYTPLHNAASDGHKEVAELLIANGADVNAKDGEGYTPLHNAAFDGHKEIAELLIAEGADVNVQDKQGSTSLDWAAVSTAENKKETADLLRKHGGKTGEELKAEGK